MICRLPPTNTLYLGIFTGLMGTASLYHTMSGCGVPAQGGEDYSFLLPPSPPCHCDPFLLPLFFLLFHSCSGSKLEKQALTSRLTGNIHHLLHLSADVRRRLFDKHRILCFQETKVRRRGVKAFQKKQNTHTKKTPLAKHLRPLIYFFPSAFLMTTSICY